MVGPSWIGDMVMAQSTFIRLRERMPEATIDVLAPPVTAALAARMPEVDSTVIMDIGHGEFAFGKRRRIARRLRDARYDQAVVLQRSAKAALVPWLAGIPKRTGVRGELRYGLINDVRHIDTERYPRKVEHYALLALADAGDPLGALRLPRLTVDAHRRRQLITDLSLDCERAIVGFAPGAAYGGAKQWPATHFAQLAAALDARGVAVWIFGSTPDRALAAKLAAAAPRHGVNLCERTSLTDIADLASLTTSFVGNDTGVMHLAAATAARVIAIYGSTDPDYAPPLAAREARFWLGLACSPCRERVCPLGHNNCMRDIRVADVLSACLDEQTQRLHGLHYAN